MSVRATARRASDSRLATVTATLLALAAAPVAGLVPPGPLPSTAEGFLVLASALVTLLLVAVAPATADAGGLGGGAARVMGVLLAALPALGFGVGEASGGSVGHAVPTGVALALAVALLLLAVPPRWRGLGGALVVSLWVLDLALASTGSGLLPPLLNPAREPLLQIGAAGAGVARAPWRGARPGTPLAVAAEQAPIVEGPGPWWVVAEEGPLPRAGPVVLVLDGSERSPKDVGVERLSFGADDTAGDVLFVARAAPTPFAAGSDLAAYEALVVNERAWPKDARASVRAAAVEAFVRAGGLLVGPETGATWPPQLARALGPAAHGEDLGESGARGLGLGHVARSASPSRALALLRSPGLRRRLGTAFDGLATPPAPPPTFDPWVDRPVERRGQGLLLLAFALAVAVLGGQAKRLGAAFATWLLPAAVTLAGIAWASPGRVELVAEGLGFDLGGSGGARVEALWLSAGPRGYVGRVAFVGGGTVRWIGPDLLPDGRVVLPPGTSAWAVRTRAARGAWAGWAEAREAGFLGALLRGAVDPAQLAYGRIPALDVRVEGLPAVPAFTVTAP